MTYKNQRRSLNFMDNKKLIVPKKLQGFWELKPKEQMLFSSLLNKIEEVFRANCFVPLDTPVLEYSEVLLAKSGGDVDKEIYRFSKGSTDICMRYDLTVPLARFVSMYKEELNFPFKRYQIGKVYRGERPQKGRFREFYQCDADIIGKEALSIVADAECVNLYEKCFKALGLDVEIAVSNRKIIAGYIEGIQKDDKTTDILVALDKLDKIGTEETIKLLQEIGLTSKESENLIKITKSKGSLEEVVYSLKSYSENNLFIEGIEELKELSKYINLLGTTSVVFDISIIRGHNYYTGSVFEVFLKNRREIALGGGGRYENLCGYFSETKMPGVGMSIGITRLFDLLLKENYFDLDSFKDIDCAIITFDETFDKGLEIMSKLRENGVKAECFYENKSFKSKMKEANRRDVKYVVIIGEDEVNSQIYTLKNMQTAEQSKLSLKELVEKIKNDRM
ncbi:MAG: histidine--tRNA ligase [Clostridiales bacterium]|nr:histidine--tRNA ligase [Clostridiales bacterium]